MLNLRVTTLHFGKKVFAFNWWTTKINVSILVMRHWNILFYSQTQKRDYYKERPFAGQYRATVRPIAQFQTVRNNMRVSWFHAVAKIIFACVKSTGLREKVEKVWDYVIPAIGVIWMRERISLLLRQVMIRLMARLWKQFTTRFSWHYRALFKRSQKSRRN